MPNPERHSLLLRKGVYPSEYMDDWSRFEEVTLLQKEALYSKVSLKGISDEDYTHRQKVWETCGCATLGNYHDLYLRTDVLLLSDVLGNLLHTCLNQYGLDPSNCYTSPGLSWDPLLKHTGVELELLTDIDMHLFFEKGLRCGISMASKRFAKANNPEVPDFDPSKLKTWIQYYDANNLYGWAMS